MAKQQIVRKASDNKYLHRHFHVILNIGLEYLRKTYGGEAVRDYLRQYAAAYYAPLRQRMIDKGLPALKEYFRDVYEAEEASGNITFENGLGKLTVRVRRCPAVAYLQNTGTDISPLYMETTHVIGKSICEGTPYEYELAAYDETDGSSVQRFYRRAADRS